MTEEDREEFVGAIIDQVRLNSNFIHSWDAVSRIVEKWTDEVNSIKEMER